MCCRLATDRWLRTLSSVLHVGSLRCCRLLLRALKLVLPLRDPLLLPISLFAPPSASEMPSPHISAEGEIGQIEAEIAPRGEGGEGDEGGGGGGQGEVLAFLLMLLADQVAGEISGEHYTLFSSGSFWRNAQVGSATASETVALLRTLMSCEGWAAPLQATPHVQGHTLHTPRAGAPRV